MVGATVASSRTHWLLAFAALCMLAQSALLPLASSSTDVWTPIHRHVTLNGVVPSHTHTYDSPVGQTQGKASCVVDDRSSTDAGNQHQEAIVCAPDDSGATASVTAAVQHWSSGWELVLPGVESVALSSAPDNWQSLVLPILTPPPRL